jgi:hypothetical protein
MRNAWALAWASLCFAGSSALFFASYLLAQDGQWSQREAENFLFDEGMAKYCCYIETTKTLNQRQRAKIRRESPLMYIKPFSGKTIAAG